MNNNYIYGECKRMFDVEFVDNELEVNYTDFFNEDDDAMNDVINTEIGKLIERDIKRYIEYVVATTYTAFDFAVDYDWRYRTFKEDWGWEREIDNCNYKFIVDKDMPTAVLDAWGIPYMVVGSRKELI